MKYIKDFFTELKNSFYNPAVYKKISAEPTGNRIWFLAKINLVAITIAGLIFLILSTPDLIDFSKSNHIEQEYPEDLIVSVEDGIVSINKESPLFIEFKTNEEDAPENLLVIDTRDDLSMDTMIDYDSLAVVTNDSFVFFKSENETRIFSLSDIDDFEMTKEKALSWWQTAIKWGYFLIIPITLLLSWLIGGFIFAYYLLVTFVYTLLTLLIAKLLKIKLTYMNAYTVTLYAIVPMLVLDLLMICLGFPALAFLDSLVILAIVVFINLRDWKNINEMEPEIAVDAGHIV